ncbi:MAG: ABC transporter permease [Muribaculaceae bacterium]|nr:ABC transporter permease [Muribaculaceae bacterium]
MRHLIHNISKWTTSLYRVWRREFRLVFTDAGVVIFFFLLPTLYPLVYTLIYNPEIVRDIPVAVVDNCRTTSSREFTRMVDATEAIKIIGYASTLNEARQWHAQKACYGILEIPEDYGKNIGRGEQSSVIFYSDMSLLIRYRGFLSAMTDLSLATGTKIRQKLYNSDSQPINSSSIILGDTTQGFASFVIPGILVLIIQQSLILGIAMLGGGANERRLMNRGIDPLAVKAPATATIIGKALCYFTIYIPLVIYILYFVPIFFNLPNIGNIVDYLLFIVPFLFSSIFLGMIFQRAVTERESSMLIVVFSSVVFLFLSGLTWPRYAMSKLWIWIGNCIPATWGVEGFIRINSNGATLEQNTLPYLMLWLLTCCYFIIVLLSELLTKVKTPYNHS